LSELGYDPQAQPVFDTRKDISTPPFMQLNHIMGLMQHARDSRDRPLLAAFAGKLWPDVAEAFQARNAVKQYFGNKEDCKIVAEVSMGNLMGPRDM
jgi:hypothetical protein